MAALKGDDPLRQVTVVVPRNTVGLATRRLLASGDLGPPPGQERLGVLNVRFSTLPQLVGQIAGATLSTSGRLPATAAVVHAAVRAALHADPGPLFGPVKDHPATVRTLANAYRDLRGLTPAATTSLAAQSERASEVVRLARAVGELLAGWYDDIDLITAAIAIVGDGPGSAGELAGPLAIYLPLRLSTLEEQFLKAMAGVVPVVLLVGTTGDDQADQPSRELVGRFSDSEFTPEPPREKVHATAVASCPSADVEVLWAVRGLMAHRDAGVAMERMAIAHAGVGPYPRQVLETLARAGIPFNGTGVRPLSSTIAGRALTGIFEIVDHDWRRDDVMAWMSSIPLVHDGREVRATEWDLVSRDAGVTTGLDNWREHLGSHAASRRADLDLLGDEDDDTEWRRNRYARAIERTESLAAFLEGLATRFDALPDSWAGWTTWSRAILKDYLGGPAVGDTGRRTNRRPSGRSTTFSNGSPRSTPSIGLPIWPPSDRFSTRSWMPPRPRRRGSVTGC